jgi:hypothetical protein
VAKFRIVAVLFALTCCPNLLPKIQAECWGYYDVCETCVGKNCKSEYCFSICVDGCTPGTCDNEGGGGVCCGKPYDSAVISEDPDGGPCDGTGRCYFTPPGSRAALDGKSLLQPTGAREAALPLYPRMPRVLFYPNRCTHMYEAIFEGEPQRSTRLGGM